MGRTKNMAKGSSDWLLERTLVTSCMTKSMGLVSSFGTMAGDMKATFVLAFSMVSGPCHGQMGGRIVATMQTTGSTAKVSSLGLTAVATMASGSVASGTE